MADKTSNDNLLNGKLLTKQDLAERWQVSIRTIENWHKDGIIHPVKGIPTVRFHPNYIAELEGVELKATSPLRVKRLEREIEDLKKENDELKGIIARVLAEASKVMMSSRKEA